MNAGGPLWWSCPFCVIAEAPPATIWPLPRATGAALRIHQESTKRGLRRFSHRKKRNERAGTPAGFPPDDKRARTPAGFAPFLSFWSATAVARDRLPGRRSGGAF